jgi:hypothetical protein
MPIQFMSDLAQVRERPEIEAVAGGEFVRGLPKILSTDTVKAALRDALRDMTEYLNSIELGDGPFRLDEAEMTIQVDQSGKVNLMLADVGGKVSGGIRLKWKRSDSARGSSFT